MLIFNTKADLQAKLYAAKTQNTTIGFVPTMGALHLGHLSLLEQSIKENDITVISIFVNPTQFNNPEDLEKYPRTLDADIEKIETVSPNIIVFTPTAQEMYNGNIQSGSFSFDGLEFEMEGKHRPGHFNGVGTIVKSLLEIITPTNAYFGEKDFQQLQIVKKLVEKNNLPVNIIGCPIHRESSGLARSSRNERLSKKDKDKSAYIYKILQSVKEIFKTENPEAVIKYVENAFITHPEFKLEYFEISDEETLKPISKKEKNKKYRAFIAVFIGNIRLIDNISLN